MKDTIRFGLTIALLACSQITVAIAQEPAIRVAGIQVVRETVGEDFDDKLVPFNTQDKGTSISLLIDSGKGSIINLDGDASTLDSFTDDKGTNLMAGERRFGRDGFSPFSSISKDGKTAMTEIRSEGVIANGATSLIAKGTVILQTGSQTKSVKSDPFILEKGAKVKVGDISLTIKNVGKPDFGDAALEVEVATKNKTIETLAGVKFLNESGAEIETRETGYTSSGFGGMMSYTKSYGLKKAVAGKSVVLEFEVWTDFEEKKVPFEITTGLGG